SLTERFDACLKALRHCRISLRPRSAPGHDPSSGDVGSMSALAHFADSSRTSHEVREVPLATLVHCGRPAGGLAVAFPSHVTLVISIIDWEVSSCELPASCLWSSRCWLSPVLLRNSRPRSGLAARNDSSPRGVLDRNRSRCLDSARQDSDLYRVPEIVTRGRFPDGGESDSTWRTQEDRHVGSDTIAPGF